VRVEFFRHNIGPEDVEEVGKVLKSLFLTTGDVVREFEERFADYLAVKHGIGLTSCTGAIHLSLAAYGIGPGDEVITTPMTFVATTTAILQAGAKPVFVDVEKETGNIDATLIESAITEKTKAVIPVHLYGQMCDMKSIRSTADRHGLKVIEDAAHCIEGEREGFRPGQLGDTACFSFYATKNITCGEGGAAVTNEESVARKLKLLRHHGITKNADERHGGKYQHWDMEYFGWKYNMDNIQAALLLNQLVYVCEKWKRRDEIHKAYNNAFTGTRGIELAADIADSKSARHLFTIWVDPLKRDEIVWRIQEKGVGVAVNFRPVHLLKYFRETYGYEEGDFKEAEKIGARTITLPLYPKLIDEEVNYVIDTVKEAIKKT
jgi:dTDP-4-amino-4,6-dideoxygalactose transaminase